jgi:hypothetical protein
VFVSSNANSMLGAKARYGGRRDFRQETRHGAQGKSGRQRSRGLSDPGPNAGSSICLPTPAQRPIDRGFRQGRADRRPGAETDPRSNKPALIDLDELPAFEQVSARRQAAGGYGERIGDPKALPAALERALHAVTIDRRQALLNVICCGP